MHHLFATFLKLAFSLLLLIELSSSTYVADVQLESTWKPKNGEITEGIETTSSEDLVVEEWTANLEGLPDRDDVSDDVIASKTMEVLTDKIGPIRRNSWHLDRPMLQPDIATISFATYKRSSKAEIEVVMAEVSDKIDGSVRWPQPRTQIKSKRDLKWGGECSICLESFTDKEGKLITADPPWEMGCASGHQFHWDCIVTWLQTSTKCPMSREEVIPTEWVKSEHIQAPLAPRQQPPHHHAGGGILGRHMRRDVMRHGI